MKLTFCLHRLPTLSRAQFLTYWRETHAPLVKRHAALLGIRRYLQTHTLDDSHHAALAASRGNAEPYDGIAELWFDVAVLSANRTNPIAQQAGRELLEDEMRFIDLARSPLFFGDEIAIIG